MSSCSTSNGHQKKTNILCFIIFDWLNGAIEHQTGTVGSVESTSTDYSPSFMKHYSGSN